ncbi:hypothetical protein QQF64_003025 [Cirrhinus molitorella]|uniref:Uncharacterized protein n=1 Tax=Cirrhinus molitorella TaxID=172907 RepID=A0ABR3MIZ0_9TELE
MAPARQFLPVRITYIKWRSSRMDVSVISQSQSQVISHQYIHWCCCLCQRSLEVWLPSEAIIKTLPSVDKSFLGSACLNTRTNAHSCSMFDRTNGEPTERFPQSIKECVKQVACRGREGHESGRQTATKARWVLCARTHVVQTPRSPEPRQLTRTGKPRDVKTNSGSTHPGAEVMGRRQSRNLRRSESNLMPGGRPRGRNHILTSHERESTGAAGNRNVNIGYP